MLAGESVQLLGEMLCGRSDLDARGREAIEVRERARYLQRFGRQQLFRACGNVEANGGKDLARQLRRHVETKTDVERLRRAYLEDEAIIGDVYAEKLDQTVAQFGTGGGRAAPH